MARQTEVVLLLLLALAAAAFDAKEGRVNGKCPSGWVTYGGRCYLYQANRMDWASAEKRCLDIGAHLVSIHSEYEYQLVKAVIRAFDPRENPTWTGLTGCQKKFNWFWSDGSRLTFTMWNPDEPNFQDEECCVHVNWASSKNWNDIPCDLSYPFVCARSF
ncbi:lactose-binding lectin l-2-like [Clarias gariepinus]|uniref:lactose-binding lectin l-2-like n=1 Tax=Clarias gariepinus TaxID=13013 RepID=UPI00234DD0FC|nr:lactose-binding lectin l-2-like [Clarias gariepinus]